MSFSVGGVTLPMPPQSTVFKSTKVLKSVSLMVTTPLILDMGPATPVLSLRGIVAEGGKTASEIETSYLLPLQAMVEKGIAIPRLFADDGQYAGSYWYIWSNDCTLVLSDDTTTFARGVDSLKWSITPGTGGNVQCSINHEFSPHIDLSSQDFICWWFKGINSGLQYTINIYSTENIKYTTLTDDSTSWKRVLVRKDQLGGDSVFNWKDVRLITLYLFGTHSGAFTINTDRAIMGVGYLVSFTDTRYDGVYALSSFNYNERERAVASFDYDMELWFVDDYY